MASDGPQESLGDGAAARLFVGNISHHSNESRLIKLFMQFGKVKDFRMVYWTSGPHRGKPRGFAFVQYETVEEAQKAQASANGTIIDQRPLRVCFAEDNRDRDSLDSDRFATRGGARTGGKASHTGSSAPKPAASSAAAKEKMEQIRAKLAALQKRRTSK